MEPSGRQGRSLCWLSTIATNPDATNCRRIPKWALCHKSVRKKSIWDGKSNGSPVTMLGRTSHGASVCNVVVHSAFRLTSSNGYAAWPTEASCSCPALHLKQMPLQAFLDDGPFGTCEKLLLNDPSFWSAGRSLLSHVAKPKLGLAILRNDTLVEQPVAISGKLFDQRIYHIGIFHSYGLEDRCKHKLSRPCFAYKVHPHLIPSQRCTVTTRTNVGTCAPTQHSMSRKHKQRQMFLTSTFVTVRVKRYAAIQLQDSLLSKIKNPVCRPHLFESIPVLFENQLHFGNACNPHHLTT